MVNPVNPPMPPPISISFAGGPPSRVAAMMKKLMPRDFSASPRILKLLKVENYDREADLNQLEVRVEL
jgi:hypothetical protein